MGSHTWEIVHHWDELLQVLHLDDEVARTTLIERLKFCFGVIYSWDFNSLQKKAAFVEFKENVSGFIEDWKHFFGRGKYRNYYHWLEVESIKVNTNSYIILICKLYYRKLKSMAVSGNMLVIFQRAMSTLSKKNLRSTLLKVVPTFCGQSLCNNGFADWLG